jgi:hypothetical protein
VIILKDLETFYSVPILQKTFLLFVSSAGDVIQSVTPIKKISKHGRQGKVTFQDLLPGSSRHNLPGPTLLFVRSLLQPAI